MEQNFADMNVANEDYKAKALAKGEYEYCTFTNCDFYNTNLATIRFIECVFTGCNLSMANLNETVLRDIKFTDCKMMGLRFDTCSNFGLSFSFENCILDHSSFYGTNIRKTVFKNTQLKEVDFSGCDLTGSTIAGCDLQRALFENTVLEKTDLRTSYNYTIDPAINKIKRAKFSLSAVAGLLDRFDIDIDSRS